VEEEYQIVNPGSRELRPRAGRILPAAQRAVGDEATAELYLSQLEIGTPVCRTLAEARTAMSEIGLPLIIRPAFTLGGTGGGIANVTGQLRHDTVMVFNGDVLSGVDLGELLEFQQTNHADVTLHLVRVGDPRAFGCVPTDEKGRVVAFLEKTQDPPTDQINAGCYVFERGIIDRIPRGREVSVEREVFPALLSDADVKICGYVDASYWRDMGTPEDFVRGSADLVRGIAPSPALHGHRGEQLVHDGATVSPGAVLIGGTVVGRGAEIGPGVRLDGAVIFDGVKVEAGSVIERSIIAFGVRIGPRALIRDGVIGDGADIGARCELLRGARVWPGVSIPDGGIRYSSDV